MEGMKKKIHSSILILKSLLKNFKISLPNQTTFVLILSYRFPTSDMEHTAPLFMWANVLGVTSSSTTTPGNIRSVQKEKATNYWYIHVII